MLIQLLINQYFDLKYYVYIKIEISYYNIDRILSQITLNDLS